MLDSVISGTSDAVFVKDLQGRYLMANPAAANFIGKTVAEVLGSDDRRHFPAETANLLMTLDRAVMAAGRTQTHEERIQTQDGRAAIFLVTKGPVRDHQGNVIGLFGISRDISERKQFELDQREAATVFDSSYDGIMVVNSDMHITKVNPSFSRITGYSQDEVIGKSPSFLESGRHDKKYFSEMWRSLMQDHFWRGEIWNRRKDGQIYAELLSISAVRDGAGAILHYIGIFSDISHIKAHEDELDRVAHYDALTGTPNRRLLADRLAQAILRAGRSENALAVCYLDLDGFKSVNDQYGHAAGDKLLIGVTANLKRVLRADDTLARLGGDEFVVLLADIGSPEECSQILERLLDAVTIPIMIDDFSLQVTASVGVSLFPQDPGDADTLLRHADQAMYMAKEAGKNRFHMFDPDSDRKAQSHREFLDRLRTALAQNEFRLYYQPKVDLGSGAIVGAEALIRWQHPEQGVLAPGAFLSHAYGSSLECPIGAWVIETALQQMADWNALGQPVNVSVNVSAAQLLQPGFSEYLKSALRDQPGVRAAQLELEVLETAAIADFDEAIEVIRRCRVLGVSFALDDFGTGYSSLTYLRRLPVDMLKIDQSFVRDMLKDPDDLGIVEGVIQLAAAFNRSVIAEGVETMEHGAALLRLGCPLVQGYGIARPMPADQLPAWSADWTTMARWQQAALPA
jgi:diguanylate cyclase (GGDEF)-like protein/PAS domain S-box-containing protein